MVESWPSVRLRAAGPGARVTEQRPRPGHHVRPRCTRSARGPHHRGPRRRSGRWRRSRRRSGPSRTSWPPRRPAWATSGGRTLDPVVLVLLGEELPRRQRDHPGPQRVAPGPARSAAAAATHSCTSLPVPTRIDVGRAVLAPRRARSRRGPRPRQASAVPSRTGTSWRVRISAVGPSASTAIRQAWAVSLASAGRITRRPGMARMAASCSTG